jgi:hypothetical protein
MIRFFLRALHSQALSQRRGALHKSSPDPLLNMIFLRAVSSAADGAISAQFVGDIQQREGVRNSSVNIKVATRFLPPICAALASGDVGVVVILMNGAGDCSNVNYWNAVKECIFNQPLIEPGAADRQMRHILVHVSSEHKSIDSRVMPPNTRRQKAKMQRPVHIKLQLRAQINFPPVRDGEKICELLLDCDDGVLKLLQQDNVAVHVPEHGCFGYFFSPLNEVIQQRRAEFVPLDVPEMADLQLGRDLRGAFLFTEEENFRTRIKFGPAGDGVALNYANVPVERLGHSKQGKQRTAHWLRTPACESPPGDHRLYLFPKP